MGQWSVPLVWTDCWNSPDESGLRNWKRGISISGMKKFAGLSPGMLQHGNIRKMRTDQQRGLRKSSQRGKRKPGSELCPKGRRKKEFKEISDLLPQGR